MMHFYTTMPGSRVLALSLIMLLATVGWARACSCREGDPATIIGTASKAFFGEVIESTGGGIGRTWADIAGVRLPGVPRVKIRVEVAIKGVADGDVVEVTYRAGQGTACGIENIPVGRRGTFAAYRQEVRDAPDRAQANDPGLQLLTLGGSCGLWSADSALASPRIPGLWKVQGLPLLHPLAQAYRDTTARLGTAMAAQPADVALAREWALFLADYQDNGTQAALDRWQALAPDDPQPELVALRLAYAPMPMRLMMDQHQPDERVQLRTDIDDMLARADALAVRLPADPNLREIRQTLLAFKGDVAGILERRLPLSTPAPSLEEREAAFRGSTYLPVLTYVHPRMAGLDLSGRDFANATLLEPDWKDATLAGARFTGASIKDCLGPPADLRGADLSGATVEQCVMRGLDLRGARLGGAKLKEVDLSGADISHADLSGAFISGGDLSGANLTGARLADAIIQNLTCDGHTRWPAGFDAVAAGVSCLGSKP